MSSPSSSASRMQKLPEDSKAPQRSSCGLQMTIWGRSLPPKQTTVDAA